MIADKMTPEELIKLRNEVFATNKWRNFSSMISFNFIIGVLNIVSFKRILLFIKVFFNRRNLYDGMFAFLQDYRLDYFTTRKVRHILPK